MSAETNVNDPDLKHIKQIPFLALDEKEDLCIFELETGASNEYGIPSGEIDRKNRRRPTTNDRGRD